jgi:hypothetical protein
LPAAAGVISVTGLFGQSCACAGAANSTKAANAKIVLEIRMVMSSQRSCLGECYHSGKGAQQAAPHTFVRQS